MKVPGNRKERWGFGPAFFFVIASVNGNTALAVEMFGRFETRLVSEPEPIKTTLSDWGSEFDSGSRQWAISHAEAGFRERGVEVSVFTRALADLRMNSQAVSFYGRIARKEPLNEGERIPVALRVNGFSGTGIRSGYRHSDESWTVSGGISVFKTRHLMSGTLDGEFVAAAENDYDFSADVDYVYYRDVIFDRPDVEKASGIGWAFDIAASWKPMEKLDLNFRAEDLFSRIRWKDAPFTQAQANTDNKSFDDDGYAVFAPTISGTEGYRDTFYQDLDPRFYGTAQWQEGSWLTVVHAQYQFGYGLYGVGFGRTLAGGARILASYWPELESIQLEIGRGKWQATVSADEVEWSSVRAISLGLSYNY
ncbi:hypothetical protein [Marinobacter sp. PE14]